MCNCKENPELRIEFGRMKMICPTCGEDRSFDPVVVEPIKEYLGYYELQESEKRFKEMIARLG
jgi:hypothetical protein